MSRFQIAITIAGLSIAAGDLRAQGRGAASPASQAPPKTITQQSYAPDQIRRGEERFVSQCGFCHGRDAAGGETGPDLTRSTMVAADNRGDKLKPLVRQGRVAEGMPAFALSDADLDAIVAFIHDAKSKSEALGGGRRTVEPSDLAVGNADAGKRYFNGAGGCSGCHSPQGDLAGVATRYKGLTLLQRMLYPSGKPSLGRAKATITLPSGETITGTLAAEDEFSISILDASAARKSYDKSTVKSSVDDRVNAHFDLLRRYTDTDMHDVYAYLDTLR